MKFVAVTACPAGIAHTYIAKEKLAQGAESRGHQIFIETQGSVGIEDELTPQQIAEADLVLLVADIKLRGEERFKGKPVVRTPIEAVMKSPAAFIEKIEQAMKKK